MVTSVRNQKNCGACWAVSVIELIESVYAIKTGLLQTFSVQEVGNLTGCFSYRPSYWLSFGQKDIFFCGENVTNFILL